MVGAYAATLDGFVVWAASLVSEFLPHGQNAHFPSG